MPRPASSPWTTILILRSPDRPLGALERDLAAAGYGLIVKADLQQTLGILERSPWIDALLTDAMPPGGAWTDVVDSVKEAVPELPVVVCSPEPSSELRTLVRRRGAYYAEYEPYHPIAVQLLIRVALARRNRDRHWGRELYGLIPIRGGKSREDENPPRLKCAATLLALFCAFIWWPACGGRQSASGFRLPANGDPDRGRAAFVELECHRCHSVKGADLPAPSAPAETMLALGGRVHEVRTDGYLVTSIIHPSHRKRYPASVRPDLADMPDYTEAVTVRQLVDLVAFLQAHYEVLPPAVTTY